MSVAFRLEFLIDKAGVSRTPLSEKEGTGSVPVAGPFEAGKGCKHDRFAPTVTGSEVEFLRYVVPPHTSAGPFPSHAPSTIEHLYLLSGKIRMTLGKDVADLEAGDSCSCFADEPHGFDNRDGKVPAELVIVVEPPRVSERPTRRGRRG